jgi:peptidoglycan/xylan/chitin deacetylase (PgdA/CDA1 family)
MERDLSPFDRSLAGAGSLIPVVITVDVEPDDAWSNHLNEGTANVLELPRMQRILDRFGAKATLLVTYAVLRDDRARDVLRRMADESGAEIGSHLHPWENPPFMQNGNDRRYPAYPHELPLGGFRAKLECLTEAIESRLGRPTSYRAGRWGLVGEHLRVLEELGYEVDTSVIPMVDWRTTYGLPRSDGGRGGPDYRFAPVRPYHPGYGNAARPGGACITEIPVTVDFTRRAPRLLYERYGSLPLLVRRALRKSRLLRPVWCKPAEQSGGELDRMMKVALSRPASHINMALHSSELMLNGSPSTRTPEEVEVVFRGIERVLGLAAESGRCEFHTLSSANRVLLDGRRGTNERPAWRPRAVAASE